MTPHYTKAPIVEAVIDFRVAFADAVLFDILTPLTAKLSEQYPVALPISEFVSHFSFDPAGPPASTSSRQQGYRLTSADGHRVFQASVTNFTFSNLHPYETWEKFVSEARLLWKEYKNQCYPQTITRIGLRYINRLELPAVNPLSKYVTMFPQLPESFPSKTVETFFLQMKMPQQDLGCQLIVNQAQVESTQPGMTSVILDFDLAREDMWDAGDNGIWDYLYSLRERKNIIFEASITDKVRDLIK